MMHLHLMCGAEAIVEPRIGRGGSVRTANSLPQIITSGAVLSLILRSRPPSRASIGVHRRDGAATFGADPFGSRTNRSQVEWSMGGSVSSVRCAFAARILAADWCCAVSSRYSSEGLGRRTIMI